MNTFRQLLLSAHARPPLGTWVMSASPLVAEAMGHAGFDWGVIDMEHTPLDTRDVMQMLQAVASTRMQPVVRVPSVDPVAVKRVMDAGATTLLFPLVDGAASARLAVASTRYPPAGIRGVAPMSRASQFGLAPNYLQLADKNACVIVQLETPSAIESLEAVAAVDGVDAIFLGPADLSAAMGLLGQPTHPDVMGLMSRVVQRCKAIGKPVGSIGNSPEVVAQYRAMGFDFLAIASDMGLMMRGAQQALSALRTPDRDRVHTLANGTQGD